MLLAMVAAAQGALILGFSVPSKAQAQAQTATHPVWYEDSATPAGSTTGRRAAEAPILNQPAGALIARIGGVAPIFVGNRAEMTAPATGRLYLGVNDDFLADNSGQFTVIIGRR